MTEQQRLLTIGYEGSDIADFVAVLTSLGVEVLCDVRDVVSSRKRGFSKNPLAAALAAAGIQYNHFKPLGDPRDGRLAARAGEVALFRRIYGNHLRSDTAKIALQELHVVASAKLSCLMCFERDPKECHRSIVADVLRSEHGYDVRHVGVPKGFAVRGESGRSSEEEPSNDHRQGGAPSRQDTR